MTTKATTTVINLENPTITGTVTATTFSGSGASLTNIVKTINSTSGDITLSSLTDFTKSLAANGYQKFPGGLIIQWGTSGATTVTFPIAFPTACRCVQLTRIAIGDTGGADFCNVVNSALSRTSFGVSSAGSYYWIAVGN